MRLNALQRAILESYDNGSFKGKDVDPSEIQDTLLAFLVFSVKDNSLSCYDGLARLFKMKDEIDAALQALYALQLELRNRERQPDPVD